MIGTLKYFFFDYEYAYDYRFAEYGLYIDHLIKISIPLPFPPQKKGFRRIEQNNPSEPFTIEFRAHRQ